MRRCDREGVAWPRIGYTTEGVADALLGRLWSLTLMAGAFDVDEVEAVRADDHDRAMVNLRERVVLP